MPGIDLKAGRLRRFVVNDAALTATPIPVAGNNLSRVAILFLANVVTLGPYAQISPTDPTTNTGGFILTLYNPTVIFDVETYGNLVMQNWFGSAPGGNLTLTVIEVLDTLFEAPSNA